MCGGTIPRGISGRSVEEGVCFAQERPIRGREGVCSGPERASGPHRQSLGGRSLVQTYLVSSSECNQGGSHLHVSEAF